MKKETLAILIIMLASLLLLSACSKPRHTHSYEAVATAPTCTQQGFTTHTCSCGEYYADTYVNALDHCVYENGKCIWCGNDYFSEGLMFTFMDSYTGYEVDIGTCTDTDIIIPATYNGKPVTSIGASAFRDCSNLTSVKIPDSVKNIGENAFYGCDSLTSVFITDIAAWCNISFGDSYSNPISYDNNLYLDNQLVTELIIPDGVESIGDYAFCNFNSLTSVEIPDSVTSIGVSAFDYCSNLTSVFITDIAAWCNISFESSDSNPLSYANNLYLDNQLVTELIIPNGVESIGYYAFSGCTSLTSVEIPDSVTNIDSGAFSYCHSLTGVEFPNSVTGIGRSAFFCCTSLTSVVIGESVESIGERAFEGCDKLVEVVNNSASIAVTKGSTDNGYIGYHSLAVYNSGDEYTTKISNDEGYIIYTDGEEKILLGYTGNESNLAIPSYITQIYKYALFACSRLNRVEIPDGVTSIGESAFNNCENLTSVTFENTSGWRTSYPCLINSDDLSNPATAAEYLRETYSDSSWYRK